MEHHTVQSQQSALPAVHRIAIAAVEAGWSHEEGFIAAMMMLAAGVSAAEAEELFQHARRVVQ
jgi:hypothetical protein